METLLHQAALPPPTTHSNLSFIHHISPTNVSSSTRRTARLHAAARRGFGVAITDKKSKPKKAEEQPSFKKIRISQEDEIPEVVFNRILRRVLTAVFVPMGSGFGLLHVLGVLKQNNVVQMPPWLPLLTVLLSFGTSAIGIAYGTLSTSWDPEMPGSLVGFEQAQKNWPELWKEDEEGSR